MTNKVKAARVGAKFTPPTLGIEYNTGNGDEKKALKVNITDLIKANPGNPSAVLAKLTAMHPDIINEDVVSMPQILRLVSILVEKAATSSPVIPPTAATSKPAVKPSTEDSPSSPVVIKVGATIQAKLGNWKRAYSGEVLGINGDGTFHVKFEDGEVHSLETYFA